MTPPALVVHIPHTSLVVPADVAADLLLTAEKLEHELLAMTDRYTDELFALPADLATTVRFPVSRLVVDPERFVDDVREGWVVDVANLGKEVVLDLEVETTAEPGHQRVPTGEVDGGVQLMLRPVAVHAAPRKRR